MNLKPIKNILESRNLNLPMLDVLKANAELYEILLLQTQGQIHSNGEFIGNRNSEEVAGKYEHFFRLAKEKKVHLAVTPEYSCPWCVLVEKLIGEAIFPPPGKLWVIGCESITLNDIGRLTSTSTIEWIFDNEIVNQTGKFLNPVCYLFQSHTKDNQPKYVALIQFKTREMLLERGNLIKGNDVYLLSNNETGTNQLLTLICSDAFDFKDEMVTMLVDRPSLIIHVQLNEKPRDTQFSSYRKKIFDRPYEKVDIICLNWSEDTFSSDPFSNDNTTCWGTAIYTKSKELVLCPERISEHHKFGIYAASWKRRRAWAYYFHSQEAAFHLQITKVCQREDAAQLAKRTGPEPLAKYIWNSGKWQEEIRPKDDGFDDICNDYELDFRGICCHNGIRDVVKIERLLALSIGFAIEKNWHDIQNLETFISTEEENLHRITCNIDKSMETDKWRKECLGKYRYLKRSILEDNKVRFPPRISGLKTMSHLGLTSDKPNVNLLCLDKNQFATIVYVGEFQTDQVATRTYDKMADILSESEKKRLVVWYSKDNICFPICPDKDPQIDEDESERSTSITREKQLHREVKEQ